MSIKSKIKIRSIIQRTQLVSRKKNSFWWKSKSKIKIENDVEKNKELRVYITLRINYYRLVVFLRLIDESILEINFESRFDSSISILNSKVESSRYSSRDFNLDSIRLLDFWCQDSVLTLSLIYLIYCLLYYLL